MGWLKRAGPPAQRGFPAVPLLCRDTGVARGADNIRHGPSRAVRSITPLTPRFSGESIWHHLENAPCVRRTTRTT